jgi:transposase InsO family protein
LSPSGETDESHDLPHEKAYSAKHLARLAAHYSAVPSRCLIQRHCAAAESLNSLYKRELIDPKKDWLGVDDVMLATMDWVQWYNEDRIHSYSGDIPPKKYEEIYYQALESGKLTSSSQK